MSVINKIQKLPQEKKVRLMWALTAAAAVLLIAVWIVSYKWQKRTPKDLRLFETIGKSYDKVKNDYGKEIPQQ